MPKTSHFDIADPLVQAIWRFNFRPDTYVHPSWLAAMPEGKVVQRLLASGKGDGRVVSHVMQQLGLQDNVFFDFSKPLSKLALWRGQELQQLVLYLGAMFHGRLLRRVITRDGIAQLHRVLGDDVFRFLQRRTLLVNHNVTATIPFPKELGLKQRFILAGLLCLRAAFVGYPAAFWQRLLYKLERGWQQLWKQHEALGAGLVAQAAECTVLVQKIAIEMKMGVNSDGKILFN